MLYGLPVWQAALMLLEPFYRQSGQWRDYVDAMGQAMASFSVEWAKSVVWTREMPSLSKITKPGYLYGGEVGGGSYAASNFPQVGFYEWPCAVLDPVMGIEIINKDKPWWTCEGWKTANSSLEMMTDEQRSKFKQLRQLQRLRLEDENGFDKFKDITINIGNLRKPPAVSASLAVHPEHLRVIRPATSSTNIAIPKHENVTDPGGTVWTGTVVRSSVTVKAPISVQPNPYVDEHTPRRAASDIVFGYDITVTPVGGKRQTLPDWHWPLSLPGFPTPTTAQYRDLYHDKAGVIKPFSKSHQFKLAASTWKTVTDGKHRDKTDEAEGKPISFSMTVDVKDQAPDGLIPFDESDPEQVLWNRQHGVIWVTIEADMNESQDRSFEVIVEVKETVAVDEKGRRKGTDEFQQSKTYTLQMPMPVDVYQINVPPGYFDWMRRFLEPLRHVSQRLDIPHPEPDPDPVLELSLWRIVLERNPALLQVHVNELRRITGRPFLMPHQALAELDATVSKLAGLKQRDTLADVKVEALIDDEVDL